MDSNRDAQSLSPFQQCGILANKQQHTGEYWDYADDICLLAHNTLTFKKPHHTSGYYGAENQCS